MRSAGERMVLCIKTLILARQFRLDFPGVEMGLMAEIEEGMEAFVMGRKRWSEAFGMVERLFRKCGEIRDVEMSMKRALGK